MIEVHFKAFISNLVTRNMDFGVRETWVQILSPDKTGSLHCCVDSVKCSSAEVVNGVSSKTKALIKSGMIFCCHYKTCQPFTTLIIETFFLRAKSMHLAEFHPTMSSVSQKLLSRSLTSLLSAFATGLFLRDETHQREVKTKIKAWPRGLE